MISLNLNLTSISIKNFFSYEDVTFDNIKDYNVLIGKNNSGKSNLIKIFKMINENYNSQSLSKKYLFDEKEDLPHEIFLRFEISQEALADLKTYINNIVDEFVFNNPEYNYIHEHVVRFGVVYGKEYLRKEYETIYKIWRVFAVRLNNLALPFGKISLEIGQRLILTEKLKGKGASYNIGTKTLINYLNKIQEFLNSERDIRKKQIYQEAIDSIKEYAADRHLGFELYEQTKDITGDYNPIWYQKWYKATLIILNLAKFGGINPLICKPIEATLFDGNPATEGGVYQPHHFGLNEKHLLQIDRIFILNYYWHTQFNILARTPQGIQLQEQLRDAVLSLMELEKKIIDENDIRQAFGDLEIFGKKVSDLWIGDKYYDYNIGQFNKNRELIKQGKIYEFIKENFKLPSEDNPVLERFWWMMKEVVRSGLLLYDDKDLSYLFSQKDIDFIKRMFKLENL